MADDEKTMADLQERLEKTIKLLESINEEKMNGAESKEVIVPSKFVSQHDFPYLFHHVIATLLGWSF